MGGASEGGLQSITITPSEVAPGDWVDVQVSLGSPAPSGGLAIDFLSTSTTLVATPPSLVIPEGESVVSFPWETGGLSLAVPTNLRIFATDGIVSRSAPLRLIPVVKLYSLHANEVEGGFSTYGSVALNIPAQAGGAQVYLSSGNTGLVSVPTSITIPQGYSSQNFLMNTASVQANTSVEITARLGDQSISTLLNLSPAPIVSLYDVSASDVVGGQAVHIQVSFNNFSRSPSGDIVYLSSSNPDLLQVPSSVTVPYGSFGASVTGTTTVVTESTPVTITARFNGNILTKTIQVEPIPPITIIQAKYLVDEKMFKVQATTPYLNSILTYGGDPANGPFGTMQFEQDMFKGSMILETAPVVATVWSSFGGQVTVPVEIQTGLGGNSSGGGGADTGGGGGDTGVTYNLRVDTRGKGTVTTNPTGSDFPAGTEVTLTATPKAGQPWKGWSGDATGTSKTIKVTMTKDLRITANFK